MALVPIKLSPGINTQPTALLNESGWSASANLRWKDGLPEKVGGFVEFTTLPSGGGLPQALRPWTALSGVSWLGIGTQRKLFVFGGEVVSDISPLTIAALVPLKLSTMPGSATVTIEDSVNAPGQQATAITATASPGAGYEPNDVWTAAGGIGANPATQLTITTTRVTGHPTVVDGGTGGTPGAVTITGTTGTGTMFQATGTIDGGGHLVGPLTLTVPGSYTANPGNPSDEPVTSGDGSLMDATVAITMGVLAASITTPGSYSTPPKNPVAQATSSGGGTGATFNLTYAINQWIQIHDPVTVSNIVLLGSYLITASAPGFNYQIETATNAAATVTNGGFVRKFTTVAGSAVVSVNLPNHGLFTGQTVSVPDATTVGGLVLLGNYTATVVDQDNYTIVAAQAASSAATLYENNQHLQVSFIDPPNKTGTQTGLNASASSSLANWGEFLMWCPQNGPVYLWMPAKGTSVPAAVIPSAPQNNGFIFVSSQQEMLFCLGTVNSATNVFDPMLVAWSDAGDYTDFAPTVTNQAGSFRLTIGSRLVAGLAAAGGVIIWSDLAVYQGTYIGPPLVWGFQPISLNYGLVGPQALGTLGASVFWRGRTQFYFIGAGSPAQVLPCTVWDAVFKNASPANEALTVCETNAAYNEVAWEVPQINGTVVRAKVQIDSGLWDYTILPLGAATPRTAWTDQSVFGMPIGADANGVLWQHDMGKDAGDQPLEWSLTSGQIMIAEGDQMVFFRDIQPDFKFTADGSPGPGVVQAFVYVYDRPQDPPKVKGPFPITSTTRYVKGCRGRGRALQFEFRGADLGSFARLGLTRYRAAPDGRR